MKKIFALAVVFSLFFCSTSFATISALGNNTVTAEPGSTIYGGVDAADAIGSGKVLLGKMSKGVHFVANLDSTAPLGQTYALSTKHISGSKAYGTASDSTAIYFKDTGDAALGTLSAEDNGAFGAAWTSM